MAANHLCKVCGGVGHQYRVACHESWEFDNVQCCQRLVGLIALYPECHDVKHFGRANENGRGADAKLHLCVVNDWSIAKADRYLDLVFALWKLRTRKPWHVDLTCLTQFGIAPPAPPLRT
ncbi:MAG TPA: HNH endonuclease [Thermoanaerobaculia bacterium]|nr:HNH endonuclease [Thermoanaerobaculia bacterium]